MFVIANLLNAVASVLDIILTIYMWIVIIQAIVSWVNPDPFKPFVRFLYQVTEPVFFRIRRVLPLQFGGIDLTPMVVIIGIEFLKTFLVASLHQLAWRMM